MQFADLGLVVVDEQHRFGVEQRDALRGKAAAPPHMLVMTATPIPRTVAMTVFGDLETSTLPELPRAGRRSRPRSVPTAEQAAAGWTGPGSASARRSPHGHQAFVVCPRIGDGGAETDELGRRRRADDGRPAPAAGRGARRVRRARATVRWPACGWRSLHGRLPPEEKDAVMRAFAPADSTSWSRPP